MPNSDRKFRRDLLTLDGLGGLAVGAFLLVSHGWLTAFYALPRGLVLAMGCANVAYGLYSFPLSQRARRPMGRIVFLAIANFVWGIVCVALAVRYWEGATLVGRGHLLAEALVVGGLGVVEWCVRDRLQEAPG